MNWYDADVVEKRIAAEVRRQWAAAGSSRCDHVKYDWEQDRSVATGNLVCLRCGALTLYENLKRSGECHKIRSIAASSVDSEWTAQRSAG